MGWNTRRIRGKRSQCAHGQAEKRPSAWLVNSKEVSGVSSAIRFGTPREAPLNRGVLSLLRGEKGRRKGRGEIQGITTTSRQFYFAVVFIIYFFICSTLILLPRLFFFFFFFFASTNILGYLFRIGILKNTSRVFVRSSMGKFASEGKGDEFIFHCESPSANTTRGEKRCVGETRLCELKGEMSARARAKGNPCFMFLQSCVFRETTLKGTSRVSRLNVARKRRRRRRIDETGFVPRQMFAEYFSKVPWQKNKASRYKSTRVSPLNISFCFFVHEVGQQGNGC